MRIAAIALGGALGAVARYGVGSIVAFSPRGFPWPTFAVNVSGSFIAGLLVSLLAQRASNDLVSAGLVVGFLGAYTTFSAFAVQTQQLFDAGAPATAIGYVAASVILSVGAAWAGLMLGLAIRP